jgi:hypothetical protein
MKTCHSDIPPRYTVTNTNLEGAEHYECYGKLIEDAVQFMCIKCKAELPSRAEHKKHIVSNHANEKVTREAGLKFLRHVLNVKIQVPGITVPPNPSEVLKYKCPICQFITTDRKEMSLSHLSSHLFVYMCPQCETPFKSMLETKFHLRHDHCDPKSHPGVNEEAVTTFKMLEDVVEEMPADIPPPSPSAVDTKNNFNIPPPSVPKTTTAARKAVKLPMSFVSKPVHPKASPPLKKVPAGLLAKKVTGGPVAKKVAGGPVAKKVTGGPVAKKVAGGPVAKKVAGGPVAKKVGGGPVAKKVPAGPMAKKRTMRNSGSHNSSTSISNFDEDPDIIIENVIIANPYVKVESGLASTQPMNRPRPPSARNPIPPSNTVTPVAGSSSTTTANPIATTTDDAYDWFNFGNFPEFMTNQTRNANQAEAEEGDPSQWNIDFDEIPGIEEGDPFINTNWGWDGKT